jgi:hypothetical protein
LVTTLWKQQIPTPWSLLHNLVTCLTWIFITKLYSRCTPLLVSSSNLSPVCWWKGSSY